MAAHMDVPFLSFRSPPGCGVYPARGTPWQPEQPFTLATIAPSKSRWTGLASHVASLHEAPREDRNGGANFSSDGFVGSARPQASLPIAINRMGLRQCTTFNSSPTSAAGLSRSRGWFTPPSSLPSAPLSLPRP